MLLLLALGCAGDKPHDPSSPSPTDTAAPEQELALVSGPILEAVAAIGGARRLQVAASRPTTLLVTLDGPGWSRSWEWPQAAEHDVPIVGLHPGEPHTVHVVLTDESGEALDAGEHTITGDTLPVGFPDIEVLTRDPARVSPGYTLTSAAAPGGGPGYVLLLDEAATPVWWAAFDPLPGDLRLTGAGTILGLGDNTIVELDWLGNVHRHLEPDGDVHHEVFEEPDGTLVTLGVRLLQVDAYPTSYTDPSDLAPALILDNTVLRLDPQGEILHELSLASLLDTTRIGFGSLERGEALVGLDWAHANAVAADTDGSWVVSLRHQDALVKVTPDGQVRWILGDPAGWAPPLADLVLEPTDPGLRWPYHAHAPELAPDGRILLFDNGNDGYTPYGTPPAEEPTSRVVELEVDEAAGTVAEVWSYDPGLYSFALGDADRLDNGNVLGVWGFLRDKDGTASARLIEVTDAGEVVLDVRLGSDGGDGWTVYRAERLPELLPGPQ